MNRIFLLFLFISSMSFGQMQIGSNIYGETAGDNSGRSISLSNDGTRMAIGANRNSGNGLLSGHVRVYEYDGNDWLQIGADIDGESVYDQSGISLSISGSGDILAIGSSRNNNVGSGAGHIRVFEYDGNNWVQLGSDIDGEATDDAFGESISLSNDGARLVAGAYGNDNNGNNTGNIRIFENNNGSWIQLGNSISGDSNFDGFGLAVSISGDGNVISATSVFSDYTKTYTYASNSWQQLGSTINGQCRSLSLSNNGSIIAIGTNETNGFQGSVRIFENDSGTWQQIGQTIQGEHSTDNFGYVDSTRISGDGQILVVGAYANSDNGNTSGSTRIFKYYNNLWNQIGVDIDGDSPGDESGFSVSISDNGNKVAIGAQRNDVNGSDSGQVKVFDIEELILSTLDFADSNVSVYPNPVNNSFFIRLKKEDFSTAIIYNINGQVVLDKINLLANTDSKIDISFLNSGIYFLKVSHLGGYIPLIKK